MNYDRETLSVRELQIIRQGAQGAPNKVIAKREFVTEQTVKFHMSNAFRKLGVTTRTAAVWRCLELGLIDPPVRLDDEVKACPHCGKAYL